jgi:hypothetical protein
MIWTEKRILEEPEPRTSNASIFEQIHHAYLQLQFESGTSLGRGCGLMTLSKTYPA